MIKVWWVRCEDKCRTNGKGMNRIHCDVVDWKEGKNYGIVLRQEILR